jgi:hypothetical protein
MAVPRLEEWFGVFRGQEDEGILSEFDKREEAEADYEAGVEEMDEEGHTSILLVRILKECTTVVEKVEANFKDGN